MNLSPRPNSLLLSPSLRPAACLLPVCLVPRLKFQNFLLQATFRAASVVHVCVCVCETEFVQLSPLTVCLSDLHTLLSMSTVFLVPLCLFFFCMSHSFYPSSDSSALLFALRVLTRADSQCNACQIIRMDFCGRV